MGITNRFSTLFKRKVNTVLNKKMIVESSVDEELAKLKDSAKKKKNQPEQKTEESKPTAEEQQGPVVAE